LYLVQAHIIYVYLSILGFCIAHISLYHTNLLYRVDDELTWIPHADDA